MYDKLNCRLCPRACGGNREIGNGYCKSKDKISIARVSRHMWEEPCISGKNGSGTIFFSGCNMGCVFCQNRDISHTDKTFREFTADEFAKLLLKVRDEGVHNINLVTPTHFSHQIAEGLALVKDRLHIPVVYNTSGYDDPLALEELRGLCDIFLTDIKYCDGNISKRYSNAENYFDVVKAALSKMLDITGKYAIENGLMKSGVIVRHMIMPGVTKDSLSILRYLKDNFHTDDVVLSLMSQYTPYGNLENFPEIKRKLTSLEYRRVCLEAEKLDFFGYFQEKTSSSENFIPDFNKFYDF